MLVKTVLDGKIQIKYIFGELMGDFNAKIYSIRKMFERYRWNFFFLNSFWLNENVLFCS